MIPKGIYPSGDNFGARLVIDFTKDEVITFLLKRGYLLKEVSGPHKRYRDETPYEEHVTRMVVYNEGDSIPTRMDDDVLVYQMGLQPVFLYEIKKKLLEL